MKLAHENLSATTTRPLVNNDTLGLAAIDDDADDPDGGADADAEEEEEDASADRFMRVRSI